MSVKVPTSNLVPLVGGPLNGRRMFVHTHTFDGWHTFFEGTHDPVPVYDHQYSKIDLMPITRYYLRTIVGGVRVLHHESISVEEALRIVVTKYPKNRRKKFSSPKPYALPDFIK